MSLFFNFIQQERPVRNQHLSCKMRTSERLPKRKSPSAATNHQSRIQKPHYLKFRSVNVNLASGCFWSIEQSYACIYLRTGVNDLYN